MDMYASVLATGRILIEHPTHTGNTEREWWAQRGIEWHLTQFQVDESDVDTDPDYAPVSQRDMLAYVRTLTVNGGSVTTYAEET